MKKQFRSIVRAPVSRRRVLLGLAAATTLASLPSAGHAAPVTLTATDAITTNSFITGTRWSDGQAPNAANDYFVNLGLTLRTPSDGNSVTFGGNSLTVGDNGAAASQLLFKNLTNSIITVNNLTLNKATVANGGTSAAAATTLTLAGNAITVGDGGATFDSGAAGRFISVTAPIGGSGPVTIANMGGIGLTAANTYTGSTTVTNGALNATDGVGLPIASTLFLNGGALATGGTFTRNLGTNPGEVTVTSTGGFSAVGGDLTIALGGTASPTQLAVGVNGFSPTNMPLNYSTATNAIDFRNPIDLNGSTTFGIQTNTTTLAGSATLSGVISDSVGGGVLTKINAGLLTLTGVNTYSGRTAVNGGFLRGTDGVNLPSTTNISFNGGVLAPVGSTFTRAIGTGPGQVSWAAAGSGGFTALTQDLTVALGGTASPTPLVWGVTEGFNPNVVLLGGRLGTNTVTLTNPIDLSTSTTAIVRTLTSHGGTGVVSGIISNSGAVQGVLGIEGDGTVGSGTIILSGANTYGGTTLIDTGTAGAAVVRATNSSSFGTSLVQFNTAGNASTARLELTNNISLPNNVFFTGRGNTSVAIQNLSGNNTIAGTLSLSLGGGTYIIQSDSGTLTLSGASGSTAGTAITAGNATGARTVTVQGAGNGVVSGAIANGAGTVSLTKAGAGTWTLTAPNTFTGAVAINAGTLQLGNGTAGNDGTLTTSGVSMFSGTTLAFNRAGTDNTAGYVISGSGAVSKSGPGTQTLTGNNAYTGGTTVNNGTLRVNAAASTVLLNGAGVSGGTDIRNGSVEFAYVDAGSNPVTTIRGILAAAYTDAATPGVMDTGTLRSGTASAARGLGYRDNGSVVIVKAALFGDADLDGGVSINDFNALAGNFGAGSGKVWTDGDFDYDGGVSINDFNLLAGGFGQSLPPTSEMWAGLLAFAAAHDDMDAFAAVTGVPEPTSLGLLAAGATLGLRRRRATAKPAK